MGTSIRIRAGLVKSGISCAALAVAGTVVAAPQADASDAYTINGTASCETGGEVESVWVQANNGGSGFATLNNTVDVSTGEAGAIRQRFSKTISSGGTYWVSVNCKRKVDFPAKTVYSDTTNSRNPQLRCNNFPWWFDLPIRVLSGIKDFAELKPFIKTLTPYGRCDDSSAGPPYKLVGNRRPEDLVAALARYQAVPVPPELAERQEVPARGWPSGLVQFRGDPRVFTSSGDYVSSTDTRDCLQVTTGQGVTVLPASVKSSFPMSGRTASCDFPHGMWLVADQSGRQLQILYSAGHLVTDPAEVIQLGGRGRALPVSETTFNHLLARGMQVPNGHQFQAPGQAEVYQSWSNQLQHITGPAQLKGLQDLNHVSVERVPASFISRLAKGPDAILVLPDGKVVYDDQTRQQYVGMFGGAFRVTIDELGALQLVNKATPMRSDGIQYLEPQKQFINLPPYALFKAPGSPAVYEVLPGNRIQQVGNPLDLEKFKTRDGKSGFQLVPQDLIDRITAMGLLVPGAAPVDLDNSLLIAPNGVTVGYVQGGQLHMVGNPGIRDCLQRRGARVSGAGAPLPASDMLWNSYPRGADAICS